MTHPLGLGAFGFGQQPSANGSYPEGTNWAAVFQPWGDFALGLARTFVPAVIQSRITGQPPSFQQAPGGGLVVAPTVQPQAAAQEQNKWLVPVLVGGGIILLVMMLNKRR